MKRKRGIKGVSKPQKCKKFRYRNEIAAKLAMAKIESHSTELKLPIRAYRCPICYKWHLTSQSR